jgi:hypothetical protein
MKSYHNHRFYKVILHGNLINDIISYIFQFKLYFFVKENYAKKR